MHEKATRQDYGAREGLNFVETSIELSITTMDPAQQQWPPPRRGGREGGPPAELRSAAHGGASPVAERIGAYALDP